MHKSCPAEYPSGSRGLWRRCGNCRCRRALRLKPVAQRRTRHSTDGCCCDPHVLVRSAVVKQPTLAVPDHSFDKDDIRDLSNFFPVELGRKYRLVSACENFGRIMLVEQDPAG